MKLMIIRILSVTLFLLILLFGGSRCLNKDSDESVIETREFWLVTEESDSDGINAVTKKLIHQFENEHKDVTIRMEVLPTNTEERAVRLEQLRAQIMAGEGPDLFLLPTLCNSDSLIDDVSIAMRNGVFNAITDYFDADLDLGKEVLESTVMDAGIVDGVRYVLPLAYNFPVIYADPAYLEEKGLEFSIEGVNVLTFFDAVIGLNDASLAKHAVPPTAYGQAEAFSFFSNMIDYDSTHVLLAPREVFDFMSKMQTINAIGGSLTRWEVTTENYILYADAQETNTKMDVDSLDHAIDFVAIAKSIEQEVAMIPLRAADGDLVANVTYYAAVGSSCDSPELAYEFLRLFLLEETQWENIRPQNEYRQAGTMHRGWPVRSHGATYALWKNSYAPQFKKNSIYHIMGEEVEGATRRENALVYVTLDEEDVPVLDIPIDRARFQPAKIEIAFRDTLGTLNDWQNQYAPTDEDIGALAEYLIQELKWHVAEG